MNLTIDISPYLLATVLVACLAAVAVNCIDINEIDHDNGLAAIDDCYVSKFYTQEDDDD